MLGVDCKTYFDHYYGRLRDYYPPAEERVIKSILRQLAVTGSLRRDACFQLYRERMGPNPDEELFNGTMVNLENDFYITFNTRSGRYEFSCKPLRDWWLRHTEWRSEHGTFLQSEAMPEREIKETFVARQWLVDEIALDRQTARRSRCAACGSHRSAGHGKTTVLLMLRFAIREGVLAKKWQPEVS
jgi:hypothetical protein